MSLWLCYLHGLTGPTACCPSAERVEVVSSAPVPVAPAPEAQEPTGGDPVTGALGFFASCIRCGEPWDATCEKAYERAIAALRPAPEAARETEARDLVLALVAAAQAYGEAANVGSANDEEIAEIGGAVAQLRDLVLAALAAAETTIASLRGVLDLWEEREAKVCPEDVGFEEYIASLRAARETAERERAAAETRAEAAERALRDIRDNYDHEQQTHDHQPFVYGGTCRVCLAARTLDAARAARPEGREG